MDQPPAEIYITALAYHGGRDLATVIMRRHDSVGSLCEKLRSQYRNSPWTCAWLPNEPVESSEIWQKSVEHGGPEKWCTKLYIPKLLSELDLHSSTNPKCVDILFTLPLSGHLYFPVSVILEGFPDGPHEFATNVGPEFLLRDFLHAAAIVNHAVDRNAQVYFVRGHAGNRVRWEGNEIKMRHFCLESNSNEQFIIAPIKRNPVITEEQHAYLQLPSTSEMPSTAGKAENFGSRQDTTKYMDCGRPAKRMPQIPPSLYSSILAEAIDAMDQEPGKDAVKLFVELDFSMRTIYDGEPNRNNVFRDILNRFLAKYDIQFNTGSIQNYPTNGHVRNLLSALDVTGIYFHLCILEGKNEVGQGGAEPFFQDLLYYQAAVGVASSKRVNSNFPALLIILAGNSLKLFTCVFTERPTSELIGEYTFGYDRSNEKQQERGLRVVHAMLSTIQKLKAHYTSFQESAIAQPSFPYPRKCSDVDTSKPPLSFTYTKKLFEGTSYRLFQVKVDSTDCAAILKFTKRYGKDAHIFAAQEGFAPKIWGYQELSAGWKMVLMEDLTDTHARFNPGEGNNDALKNSMLAFFHRLHEAGFVHGDIRDLNILVSELGWKAVDWDWAGVFGIVHYPRHLTRGPNLPRPDSVQDLGLIQPTHDIEMIELL